MVIMESLGLLLLVVLHSSRSQLACPNPDGVSTCEDNPPLNEWLSSVRAASDSFSSQPDQYVISWDEDVNDPDLNYLVAVRELGIMPPPMPRIILVSPSADTSNFIIEDLTAGSRYVAHVCVTGTLPRDVPRGSNFSSQCGYCRTCFGVQPSNDTSTSSPMNSEPFIEEATRTMIVGDSEFAVRFTCEAEGMPTPVISWEVFDSDADKRVSVEDGVGGISIETTGERREVTSTLHLPHDSDFSMPICTARNRNGEDNAKDFDDEPDENLTMNSEPVITGGTRTMVVGDPDYAVRFTCEAEGMPTPVISWEVFDSNDDDKRVSVEDGVGGISIETTGERRAVTSTLRLPHDSDFSMPICTARNRNGEDSVEDFVDGPDENVTPEGDEIPIYVIAVAVAVPLFIITAVIVIVIIAAWCVIGAKKSQPKNMVVENGKGSEAMNNNYIQATTAEEPFMNEAAARKASLIRKLPKDLIISPDSLQVSTIIGQGEFGVVYKGYLQSDVIDTVAIKTLKGIFATTKDIENVSAEILKMSKFNHANVMRLIGVCVAPSDHGDSGTGPCIVMPFMAKGSLLDFLRKEADNLYAKSEDDVNNAAIRKKLLQMCLQIAEGMKYLAGLKFIHRDLAARNCLMDANDTIKVSDFGLAEDIYSKNYFRQKQGGIKLPLKWMALESIKLGVFTEKTDVWSYGVTCWEIFSGGAIPYPGVHPHSILDYLEEGERLARPKNAACCEDMYDFMLSFWNHKAEERPDFTSIVNTLSNYLEITADYLDLTAITEDCTKAQTVEVDLEHSLTHVPAQANEYSNL